MAVEPLEDRRLLSALGQEQAVELFSTSPALFVENQGQWADESVRYLHQGDGVNVAMTDAGVVFRLFQQEAGEDGRVGRQSHQTLADLDDDPTADMVSALEDGGTGVPPYGSDVDVSTQTTEFSVTFDGANLVEPVGLDRAETYFNYFVGSEENWHAEVPSYEIVAYEGLYDGIDLHTWGLRSHLKYEFHVAPGADYRQIQIRYEGIEGLWVDEDGALHVEPGGGEGDSPIFAAQKSGQSPEASPWEELVDDAPYIYQVIDGAEVEVPGRFVLLDASTYTFELTGDYDPGHELVIDPDLAWSTYLGGDAYDYGYGIAVDAAGNALVTGSTTSSGWTSGGFDTSYNGGRDAFVAKLSPSGGHLWSTYLGGSSSDLGRGIAVDAGGNALVTGVSASSGWVSGGYDTTFNGNYDAFMAKLSPTGGHIWSTYLGGSWGDWGYGIAVDAGGNALVTGCTGSSGWVSGGYDTSYSGADDAFVAKLSPSGGHLWSTYLGGSPYDWGLGIAVDAAGNALVAGHTGSSGWTSGGFDTSYNGGEFDAFVAQLSPSGAHLWSTYLGGSDPDYGSGIAVDAGGNALVTGDTYSSGWTSGGFDTSFNGGWNDAFAVKLTPSGGHVWSTYLGGDYEEVGFGIAVDAAGNALVTGTTSSSGWTSGGFDTSYNGGGDAFVAKLSSSGGHLWSSYLGGDSWDEGGGIAVGAPGSVLVTGYTCSPGWTFWGFDTSYNGGGDAFVARIRDATVVGRHVFYNNSFWDTATAENPQFDDDTAVALDKVALAPGMGQASFENYTSYVGGINGIIIDIAGLPPPWVPFDPANFFFFKTGNDDDPSGWDWYPYPRFGTIRPGEGIGGSDRITLTWDDYDPQDPENTAVANAWLEVTVLNNEYTGFLQRDVFYFGNAIAETGDSDAHARVDANDILQTRNHPHPFFDPALIDCNYDFNRDARVDAHDLLVARNNQTTYFDDLELIDLSGGKGPDSPALGQGLSAPAAVLPSHRDMQRIARASAHDAVMQQAALGESGRPLPSAGQADWLREFEQLNARNRPDRGNSSIRQAVDLLLLDQRR